MSPTSSHGSTPTQGGTYGARVTTAIANTALQGVTSKTQTVPGGSSSTIYLGSGGFGGTSAGSVNYANSTGVSQSSSVTPELLKSLLKDREDLSLLIENALQDFRETADDDEIVTKTAESIVNTIVEGILYKIYKAIEKTATDPYGPITIGGQPNIPTTTTTTTSTGGYTFMFPSANINSTAVTFPALVSLGPDRYEPNYIDENEHPTYSTKRFGPIKLPKKRR